MGFQILSLGIIFTSKHSLKRDGSEPQTCKSINTFMSDLLKTAHYVKTQTRLTNAVTDIHPVVTQSGAMTTNHEKPSFFMLSLPVEHTFISLHTSCSHILHTNNFIEQFKSTRKDTLSF